MILYFLAAGGIRNQKYAKYIQDVSVFSIIHHPKAELCMQQGTFNILSLFHGSGKINRKNVVQFKNLKAHWCADTYFVNLNLWVTYWAMLCYIIVCILDLKLTHEIGL